MKKDYYQILGVPRNATKDEIKKAYRQLAHKFHPDKGGDETKFKELNEAYQILSDDQKRGQYDQFGQVFEGAGQGGFEGFNSPFGSGGFRFDFGGDGSGRPGGFDFSDIFEDFVGGLSSKKRAGERRGRDIRMDLEISFEDSIFGGKKELEISKIAKCSRCGGSGGEPGSKTKNCPTCAGKGNIQKTQRTFLGSFTQVATCPDCFGSGKRPENLCKDCGGRGVRPAIERLDLFVPKGVQDGEVLKITGKGEASLTGGAPGDLYIKLRVLSHKFFHRQGDDIVMRLSLKVSEAVLGTSKEIETLDGNIKLKIPEGTQPGDVLKIRGKGAYFSSGYGRGDLLIEIKIEIPKKLSRKAKEVIEKLKEEGI
ncbi:MAG: molecular chaperone DnaJ [bacterium]|nr:molecular chaperone DnaJ [bacterium]